jgi:hypothetical protein
MKTFKRSKDFRYSIVENGEIHVYGMKTKLAIGDEAKVDVKINSSEIVKGKVISVCDRKTIFKIEE